MVQGPIGRLCWWTRPTFGPATVEVFSRRMRTMKLSAAMSAIRDWVWGARSPHYRAWSATVFSILAPILWYAAGQVPDRWGLFLFVLNMAASVAAVVLGWCHRSGPSGWVASWGALMAANWLLIAVAALVAAATDSWDQFVAASDWVNSQLASMGNTVEGFDAAVLVVVATTGASGLAGLAVVVPLGTRQLSARSVEMLDGAIDLLNGILVAASAAFVVYALVRLIPSPTYTGAVSVAMVILAPFCVAAPPLVGFILRRAWQVLQAESDERDGDATP